MASELMSYLQCQVQLLFEPFSASRQSAAAAVDNSMGDIPHIAASGAGAADEEPSNEQHLLAIPVLMLYIVLLVVQGWWTLQREPSIRPAPPPQQPDPTALPQDTSPFPTASHGAYMTLAQQYGWTYCEGAVRIEVCSSLRADPGPSPGTSPVPGHASASGAGEHPPGPGPGPRMHGSCGGGGGGGGCAAGKQVHAGPSCGAGGGEGSRYTCTIEVVPYSPTHLLLRCRTLELLLPRGVVHGGVGAQEGASTPCGEGVHGGVGGAVAEAAALLARGVVADAAACVDGRPWTSDRRGHVALTRRGVTVLWAQPQGAQEAEEAVAGYIRLVRYLV